MRSTTAGSPAKPGNAPKLKKAVTRNDKDEDEDEDEDECQY
ncbi:hypothetical protein ACU7QU_005774 [Escherichia coli]|nr:hypothetical protein [Escherichia coli]